MTEESPFLPNSHVQWAWDSTSLGYFQQCPRKYYYVMIRGLRGKGEALPLKWGTEYHRGLERYYKLIAEGDKSHDYAVHTVVKEAMVRSWPWPDTEDKRWSRESLIRSIVWYLDLFEHDSCETIILANGKPAVELSFRFELPYGPSYQPKPTVDELEAMLNSEEDTPITINPDGSISAQGAPKRPYVICGHLDRMVNFGGHPYVMDHKSTTSAIDTNFFHRFEPDTQMTLYSTAGSVVFQTPIRGVIIDACQTLVTFSRFARGLTTRTPGQIEEFLLDLRYWLGQAEICAEAKYWPMNTKSCFLCNFKSICSKDQSVRDRFLAADFKIEPWNPLRVR